MFLQERYVVGIKGVEAWIILRNMKDGCIKLINNGFAPIGRVDKLISPKTIKYVCGENIELYEDGEYAYIKDGKLHIETK